MLLFVKSLSMSTFLPLFPHYFAAFFPLLTFSGVISTSFLVYAFCILFGSSIFMSSSLSVPKHIATTEPVSITKATQPKQAQDGSHQLKGRPSILSSFNACSALDCLGPTWTTSGSFCSTAAFPSQSSFSFGMYDLHYCNWFFQAHLSSIPNVVDVMAQILCLDFRLVFGSLGLGANGKSMQMWKRSKFHGIF